LTRFERGVVAAVLVVIAVSLVLDRQEPYREPPTTLPGSSLPPASLSAADVARIAHRVELIRDLRFKHPVTPLFVGRDEAIRLEQEGAAQDNTPDTRAADEEALKLIGLLRPQDSLAKALTAIDREQVLGFYDDRRKRLVVVRDRAANRPMLEITLAHELTHALEDQRFGLRSGGTSDDAALAQSALAEGTATVVMAEYAVRYFGIDDALALFDAASAGDTKLPTYVDDTLLFPYEQGVEFVQAFRGDSGSWKALDNVIRFRRPATAEQVIHPDKYAIDERAVPIHMPDLGLVLGSRWRRLSASSVGEVDLREIFKILGGSPDRGAAAGWGGGRFELWGRAPSGSCPAPCVTRDVGAMLLAWDTRGDRRAGEKALSAAFEKGLRARRAGPGGARLWSSRGGVIALAGSGLRTAIVLAPDSRTAARVLAQVG
jgi:hypothetical protein